jgi:hypothetical protein
MKNEDEKIKRQALSISSKLNVYNPCEIKTKYIDQLDKVSKHMLEYILSKKFIKGADMKAVLCLFDTLFLSLSPKKENGIYVLTKDIKKYIDKLDVLRTGADGIVYNATFFSDIELVIKLPINEEDEQEDEEEKQEEIKKKREMMIREYYIGIKAMNKLRYIVPNFVYTLGCFMCDKPSDSNPLENLCENVSGTTRPFIVYEKIPGHNDIKTVGDLIDNKLSFNKWLVIFFQLLLALEVAQREVEFTHFDLHFDNVMIRKQENFEYSVPLDMSTYTIKNPEFIPVIIDFGRSTCNIEKETIGTYAFEGLGVLNHMVPGQDMYTFMSYCCNKATNYTNVTDIDLRKKIALLFKKFYGKDDPYPIDIGTRTIGTRTNPVRETQEYVGIGKLTSIGYNFKKIPVTPIAQYTPLMFMKWLLDEYPEVLNQYITVTKRKIYKPIQYSVMIKKYNDIFNYVEKGIDKATSILLSSSIGKKQSYVITKYMCNLLERYNEDLESQSLHTKIQEENTFLLSNKSTLISFDIFMLEKVFDIKIPSQEDLDTCVSDVLSLHIYAPSSYDTRIFVVGNYGQFAGHPHNYKFDLRPIAVATQKLYDILRYEDELKIYLQFYFTILDLNLEDEFNDWLNRFEQSKIYYFYTNNILKNEQSRRWAKTVLISSKNDED